MKINRSTTQIYTYSLYVYVCVKIDFSLVINFGIMCMQTNTPKYFHIKQKVGRWQHALYEPDTGKSDN